MPPIKAEQLSEYELKREANIARNKELLRSLGLANEPTNLKRGRSSASASSTPGPKPRRVKKEPLPDNTPTRRSGRLRGVKSEDVELGEKDEPRPVREEKRTRVAGDLSFEIKRGLLVKEEEEEERGLTEEDVKNTADKDLREVREKFMGMKLWDQFLPNELKITPERIYSMEFHPTNSKPLIMAADKKGSFGILDASTTHQDQDDEDNESRVPDLTSLKPHTRTIPAFIISHTSPNLIYTASYDNSIRCLDLTTGKSSEVVVLPNWEFSGVQQIDAHTLLFSTITGDLGTSDTRTRPEESLVWEQFMDKKIGGLSINPADPTQFATASLDRTVKLWDLRHATSSTTPPVLLAQHTSNLSVSAVSYSPTGHKIATTSYDDTVKIHRIPFPTAEFHTHAKKLAAETDPAPYYLAPEHVVKHNNQTGRWVTILRPVWQEAPADGFNKICVASMTRGIDVFSEDGEVVAKLSERADLVTAVPAVARLHRSRNWCVGGTGSGKVVLYM